MLLLLLGGSMWSQRMQSNDPSIVARSGLHWHPTLEIYVRGEKIAIPENVGLDGAHKPVHTHDDLPVIHLEFSGVTRTDDVMLGEFFRNWGKDMRSFGANMRMTVNGQENTDYENYVMRDGDTIELHYD